MKDRLYPSILGDEDGFILVASMMILVILMTIGIAATNVTNIEQQIAANDRIINEDMYNQEACVTRAKYDYRNWLTVTTLLDDSTENDAHFPSTVEQDEKAKVFNFNNETVGEYKIRKFSETFVPIAEFEAEQVNHPANDYPLLAFMDKPDPGSGYDPANFEIRRFLVTCYSNDVQRNAVIQEGTYKVFNKY